MHALDLPGHGASGKDVGDGSLAALADSSSGSSTRSGSPGRTWWGTRWAARSSRPRRKAAPEKVASLTLLAPAGYGPDADAEYLRGFAAAVSGGS